jgi:hypothetical protein
MLRAAAAAAAVAATAAAALTASAPAPPGESPPSPPTPRSIACNFSLPSTGEAFDLAPFRGAVVSGVEAGGSEVRLSLCGDLAKPCIDALTKTPIFGSAMLFFGTPRAYHCWDTVAQWALFPPTAVALEGGGLELRFSRPGDAHLDCERVNVTVRARCNATAPAEPARATLSGAQDGCDWTFDVHTANTAVCAPRHAQR